VNRVVSTPFGMTACARGTHRRVCGDTTTTRSATYAASTSLTPSISIRSFSFAPRMCRASSKHDPCTVRTCSGARRRHSQ